MGCVAECSSSQVSLFDVALPLILGLFREDLSWLRYVFLYITHLMRNVTLMIYDNYGRPVVNLRISVTQKCDKHCPYCHREGERNPTTLMSVDEIVRIVRIAIGLRISRIKLTGGEPLLRKEIVEIVSGIK